MSTTSINNLIHCTWRKVTLITCDWSSAALWKCDMASPGLFNLCKKGEQVVQIKPLTRVQCAKVFPGSVTFLKLMKPKGLGELCTATSDLDDQTGIEKIHI